MKENKTIFVVEDSQILSEIIALQFKRNFNCNVIIFKNADNIFFNISKYLPDLIVIDYSFNDSKLNFHNGLEVIVELRKDSNIPVIVLSGQRDMAKAIEIVQKGANDYISKDDDDFMNSLLESIKETLNIRKSKNRIKKLSRLYLDFTTKITLI